MPQSIGGKDFGYCARNYQKRGHTVFAGGTVGNDGEGDTFVVCDGRRKVYEFSLCHNRAVYSPCEAASPAVQFTSEHPDRFLFSDNLSDNIYDNDISVMIKDEFGILFARIDDICRRAERGALGVSRFLSPREQHFVRAHLISSGYGDRFIFFGGYTDAERCRAYILPDYIEASTQEEIALLDGGENIAALLIKGSGYKRLTHRDFLGSLLSLGIERESVGDIVVTDGVRAVVFCEPVIADFLASELVRIGGDTVSVERVEIDSDFRAEREFSHISDTVASPRLDCVVASLCSLSREKASQTVLSGLVELDFEVESRPDRAICAPCILSVRGFGRFRVNAISEKTKKGRIRLDADKFI